MPTSLIRFGATQLLEGYRGGVFSPVEVVAAFVARIEQVEPHINALTTTCLGRALDEARAAEARYAGDMARPLEGVPFVAKDMFDTEYVRTTYGSAIFADHVPTIDAHAVGKLRSAGAILLGKAATHEFAWGVTTNNPHFGATHNPWCASRIPGGSSGGSAAALAAFEAPLAIGTDTGGSVRIPAAFCGVMALKPTYGVIDTSGAFALAPSLDHVGPMAREPNDLNLLLAALAQTPTAVGDDAPAFEDLCGLRIGVWRGEPTMLGLSADVEQLFCAAQARFADLGAKLVEVDLPEAIDAFGNMFAPILLREALCYHQRRGLGLAQLDKYGRDVRERLLLASEVSLHAYDAAKRLRARLRHGFERLFGEVDLVLSPAVAGKPPRIGDEVVQHGEVIVTIREFAMSHTVAQSLAGLPSGVVPAGLDSMELPVAIQLCGPPNSDMAVLRAMKAFWYAGKARRAIWPVSPMPSAV
ncbi:MAG: amidase [Pseudomonas fluorescens]